MSTTRKIKADAIDGVKFDQNFIKVPTAENYITNWQPYADGSATPVDGIDGAPTLTWTRSTSSPLFGSANFLLTPGALGNGVSTDFTIPSALQASVLEGTVYAEINTPSSYDSGYLAIWIYDVTNATLIQPSNYSISKFIGPSQIRFEFQAASNSTSYRLLIHQVTANTGYTVKFDNFQVGPSKVVNGSVITEKTAYTPTFEGLGTVSALTAYYWRDGADLVVHFTVTGGTHSGTAVSISLPSGITADSTKIGQNTVVGDLAASATPFSGTIAKASANDKVFLIGSGSSLTSGSPGTTWTNGTIFGGNFRVPAVGWGATAVLGQDADTRVISARARLTTAQTGIASKVIPFNSVTKDTSGSFNSSTGIFTCRVAGQYRVSTGALFASLDGTTDARIQIRKNSSIVSDAYASRLASNPTGSAAAYISDILDCVAGDTIDIFAQGDASFDLDNNGNRTFVAIDRLSGPAQIAASEDISASYRLTGSTANPSLATGTFEITDFDSKRFDTHGCVTTGVNWVFRCPRAGIYWVSLTETLAAAAAGAVNSSFLAYIRKNGSDEIVIGRTLYQTTTSTRISLSGTQPVQCVAGDTLAIASFQNTGGTVSFDTGTPSECVVSIRCEG